MRTPNYNFTIRAQDSIAQGALTNSKRPECFVKGVYQTHAKSARGPFIEDVEGRKLYDFICGLGSCILGYGNVRIAEAIYAQAIHGVSLSMPSVLELDLAEKIKEVIPWAQKMRFLKTGTEACMAAVKIARAKTGRNIVLSEGYHGWSDEFISLTPPALGCLKAGNESTCKLTDLEEINRHTAAVIVEPVMTDLSDARIQWLRDLREKCTAMGALLIFDEVITGFRTPKFTMSNYLGIEPDIICLGKAIANGMPLSVVAGKDDVMNCGEYFVSSTFAGERCSLAAGLKCIELLQTTFKIDELWHAGGHFMTEFNKLYSEKIRIEGYPTRGVFVGDPLVKALLWQESYMAGILFGSSWFINFAHIAHIERVLNILQDIMMRIKTGSVTLKGEMPKSPFSQQQREKKP